MAVQPIIGALHFEPRTSMTECEAGEKEPTTRTRQGFFSRLTRFPDIIVSYLSQRRRINVVQNYITMSIHILER